MSGFSGGGASAASVSAVQAQVDAILASASASLDTFAEVEARITALINGASSAGDTLKELEDLIALKAALASPTFTGTPAAPTAAGGTNTTQLATTAFVEG